MYLGNATALLGDADWFAADVMTYADVGMFHALCALLLFNTSCPKDYTRISHAPRNLAADGCCCVGRYHLEELVPGFLTAHSYTTLSAFVDRMAALPELKSCTNLLKGPQFAAASPCCNYLRLRVLSRANH